MVKPLEIGGSGVSAAPITETTAPSGASPVLATASGPACSSLAVRARTSSPWCGWPLTASVMPLASWASAWAASSIQACSWVEV